MLSKNVFQACFYFYQKNVFLNRDKDLVPLGDEFEEKKASLVKEMGDFLIDQKLSDIEYQAICMVFELYDNSHKEFEYQPPVIEDRALRAEEVRVADQYTCCWWTPDTPLHTYLSERLPTSFVDYGKLSVSVFKIRLAKRRIGDLDIDYPKPPTWVGKQKELEDRLNLIFKAWERKQKPFWRRWLKTS